MDKRLIAIPAIALGAATFAAAPAGAAETDIVRTYEADVDAINVDGFGEATVQVTGTTATVSVAATGLSPDKAHAQHIHGNVGANNVCPSADMDSDGDGFISTAEGVPAYGGVNTALTTEGDTSAQSGLALDRFPVAAEGAYTYERSITTPIEVARDMGNFVIVLHGADLDGSGEYDGEKRSSLTDDQPFEATIPTGCGELALVDVALPAPYDGMTGVQGQVARYYAAILDRAPEPEGFEYWVDTAQRHGQGAVANAFAISEEFQARFGTVFESGTDLEWIDFVYRVTLGRFPDAEGRAYWAGHLESGTVSRAGLVAQFAHSAEFMVLTNTT